MFKVNNKDTSSCSSVSLVNFEQVNTGWLYILLNFICINLSKFEESVIRSFPEKSEKSRNNSSFLTSFELCYVTFIFTLSLFLKFSLGNSHSKLFCTKVILIIFEKYQENLFCDNVESYRTHLNSCFQKHIQVLVKHLR